MSEWRQAPSEKSVTPNYGKGLPPPPNFIHDPRWDEFEREMQGEPDPETAPAPPVYAVVTGDRSDRRNYTVLTTLGKKLPGVPSMFSFQSNTKIGPDNYYDMHWEIRVGDIYEITKYEVKAQVASVITKHPNWDTAEVYEASLKDWGEFGMRLSMVTDTKRFGSYPDPFTSRRKEITYHQKRAMGTRALTAGAVLEVIAVNFPAGTRYSEVKGLYFPKEVETPIDTDALPLETVQNGILPVVVTVRLHSDQNRTLQLRTGTKAEMRLVGRKIALGQTVVRGRDSAEKRAATVRMPDAVWDEVGGRFHLKATIPPRSADPKKLAAAYAQGSMVTIKIDRGLNFKRHDRPASMLLSELSFDRVKGCSLALIGPKDLILKSLQVKNLEEIRRAVPTISPVMSGVPGVGLATQCLRGRIDCREGTPSQQIFQTIFGRTMHVPETVEEPPRPALPDKITVDQSDFVGGVTSPNALVATCEAASGAGKTTAIVAAIGALRVTQPGKIPLLVSTSNAPVLHAAEAYDDPSDQPLVIASLVASKSMKPAERQMMESYSLKQHLLRLNLASLDCSEKGVIAKAISMETALERERDQTEEEAEKRDGQALNMIFVEDLEEEDIIDVAEDKGAQGEDETEEEETRPRGDKKKKETRTTCINAALRILLRERPPAFVAATTAMAGRLAAALNEKTATMIVDEAGTVNQMTAAEIVARLTNLEKLVVVGDRQQLGVFMKDSSTLIEDLGYRSILQVLLGRAEGVTHTVLTTTFRFHPRLLEVVKKVCYPEMELTTPIKHQDRQGMEEVYRLSSDLPVILIDVPGDEVASFPVSYENPEQAAAALEAVQRIKRRHPAASVALICIYNGQRELMRPMMEELEGVRLSSVDAYQGQEADYVVLVTTRTAEAAARNEFFNTKERRNVAISRGRRGMVIIGKKETLRLAAAWSDLTKLLEEAQAVMPVGAIEEPLEPEKKKRKKTAKH